MPLKHVTETVLVLILALAIVVTGLIVGVLPPVSVSIFPWLAAFALAVAYPLALYPLLRSRRADYPFRLLHFVPAVMLLLWLALDILSSYVPFMGILRGFFTWGWAVSGILVAFILIALFCLQVIRQRASRLALLLAVFLPFAAFAVLSERGQIRQELAADVAARFAETGTGTQVAVDTSSSSSSSSSVAPTPIFVFSSSSSSVPALASSQASSVVVAMASSSSSSKGWSIWGAWGGTGDASSVSSVESSASSAASSASSVIVAVKPPPRLSSSGPGEIAGVGLMFAAAYCGVLHRRILKTKRA